MTEPRVETSPVKSEGSGNVAGGGASAEASGSGWGGVPVGRASDPIGTSPHSMENRIMRVVWGMTWAVFFRYSPRPLHGWRNFLLRLFGAKLHRTARVYPSAKVWAPWNLEMHEKACIGDTVDCYNVARVTIGANSTVSQYSYLCGATHDHEDATHPLVPLPITIGSSVWVAADVFVGPGVRIGDGTVVGARSSVFGDLPAWVVAVGSPAKGIKPRKIRGSEHVPLPSPVDMVDIDRRR